MVIVHHHTWGQPRTVLKRGQIFNVRVAMSPELMRGYVMHAIATPIASRHMYAYVAMGHDVVLALGD